MTVFEVLHGFEKEAHKNAGLSATGEIDLARARELIDSVGTILPFDDIAASIAAYVYPRLSKARQNKVWQDMLIAATAVANGFGVATANRKDFELIGSHLPATHPVLYLAIWK